MTDPLRPSADTHPRFAALHALKQFDPLDLDLSGWIAYAQVCATLALGEHLDMAIEALDSIAHDGIPRPGKD